MIKTKFKRYISLLTAFVMCLIVVPSVPKQADVIAAGVIDGANAGIAAASGYNPSAATAYAQKYCYNYNPNYSNYNSAGGDCANFVNQCLVAGGLKMNNSWYWKSYNDRSASWISCPKMYKYFHDNGYTIIENPTDNQVLEGNPVLYWSSEGYWCHTAICVGNVNGKPMVAAHNNDHDSIYWKLGYSKTCTILISNGNPPPPNDDWKFDIKNAPKCSDTYWLGRGTVGGVTGTTRGDDVKWLQYALRELGYNIGSSGVDGIIGDATEDAIIKFQKDQKLTADGYAGKNTINKIVEIIKGNTKLSTPKVSVNKSTATTDDIIKISCNSVNNATWYWISLYKDDKLYINQALDNSLSFSKKLPVGSYKADISAHNDYSDSESGSVSFTVVPTGSEMTKGAGKTIADGDYWIESALSKRYLVDIKGDNYDTTNGTNLKMHIWNSDKFGKYDAFTFKYLNNGFYQITQRTTNMAIDVNGASTERGTNVQMYKSNNSTAQQWSITKTSTGYKLQARCSGYCLDVTGGNIENNTNLIVWEDNGGKGQRFNLIPYKCTHSFGAWTTTKNATCTADGTQTRKCSDCGYSESQSIPKTGHSLGNWTTSKNAICTADGIQIRKCSKCSYSESKVIPKTGHSLGNWTTSKNATCTADGTQVRKCGKCSYSESKVIPKTGHKYTDKVVAPTCKEKGYTLHTCSVCKDSYKDKETNAKGHTFTSKMIGGYMTYICSDCGYMYTAPFEGKGTAESPFIISNADELRAVSDTVNNTEINPIFGHAYYRQTADIDLENVSWIPIGLAHDGDDGKGEYNYLTRAFYGEYDGNQHTICNLNVDNDWYYSGLFATIRGSGKACNLVVNGSVIGLNHAGGIVGELQYNSTIENCAFIGNVSDSKICAGGIAGRIYNIGTIKNCYHNGTVKSTGNAGGIVGDFSFNKWAESENGSIVENCYHVNGEISGNKSGAISSCCIYADNRTNPTTIKNCYVSKSSTYSERNEEATYDDTMILPDSMLKKIAEDLGKAYTDNTDSELNNGFPVFPWQLDSKLKGDADNNGVVDICDAVMLQKWLLCASDELTNWKNVDLCEDGVIDVFDLCLLKRLLIKSAK